MFQYFCTLQAAQAAFAFPTNPQGTNKKFRGAPPLKAKSAKAKNRLLRLKDAGLTQWRPNGPGELLNRDFKPIHWARSEDKLPNPFRGTDKDLANTLFPRLG